MYPEAIKKLVELFTKFPGIGPRQATRFAFFLVNNRVVASELIAATHEIKNVLSCTLCFRTMEKTEKNGLEYCPLCRDEKRDHTIIGVVEKESDMSNLEKTGVFHGLYHVLGGTISPLENDSPKRLHLKELYERVERGLKAVKRLEVILATNSTTEGDMTALYIERILAPLKTQYPDLIISRLGRGLSLGAELEYADEVTLKNALNNRK